uniref:Uncharacterized protein n=1 Tax=Romanomermis culicivorax TaxID=13658 RepID=A0A915JSH6_ROMCU
MKSNTKLTGNTMSSSVLIDGSAVDPIVASTIIFYENSFHKFYGLSSVRFVLHAGSFSETFSIRTASIIFCRESSKVSSQYFVEVLAIFVVNKATQVFAFRTCDTDPVIYKEVQM